MKKLLILLLALMMLISFTACSNDNGTASSEQGTTNQSTSESSDDWPNKPITLLVGYSAGGSSDLGARYLSSALEKELGQPVIVENVPGSGSWLAWNQLLNSSENDGYTFALVNLNAMYGHYDEANPREATIDDFELLANHVIDYQVVAIRSNETRFTDFTSLVEYSKTTPIIVAASSTGIVSGDASVAKMMEMDYGSQITIIPVDGSSDAEAMFLAGETDVLFGNVGDVMEASDNGYKVVVCFSEERSKYLPDVPTAGELGLGEYVSFSARGYAYMKGVDEEIVAKMTQALEIAYNDDEYQTNMSNMGAELVLVTDEDYYNLLIDQLDRRLNYWGVSK